ncbi:MAG: hypothetical protein M5U18_16465 [Dehalococcoidia bacterium]|nr:hypothetical protein [Dehalococcoidia bacterium]
MISSRQTRLVLFVAGVLAVAAAIGCSSNPEPGPPPQISSATAERDVVNGLASLKSTVAVQFDRPFELAPSRVPLASHFEFDVPLAVGGSRRVLVAAAERPEDDSRSIVLKVDTLIPDGATLKVARRAFDAEADGEMEVTVEGDLNPALVLLATTELQVSDPAFYDAPVLAEVTEEDRDAVAQREALEFHLNQRQVDPQTYLDALAIYDAISVDIVASPKLRGRARGADRDVRGAGAGVLADGGELHGLAGCADRVRDAPGRARPDRTGDLRRERGAGDLGEHVRRGRAHRAPDAHPGARGSALRRPGRTD